MSIESVEELVLFLGEHEDPSLYQAALTEAIKSGEDEVVAALLTVPGIYELARSSSPLILASQHGCAEVVERLLAVNDRIDPMKDYNAALVITSQAGHLAIVNRLLQLSDLNSVTLQSAFVESARCGHFSVVNRLLELPQLDPTSIHTALSVAAWNGHVAIVDRLLQLIDVREESLPLLIRTFEAGHSDVVESLIKRMQKNGCLERSDLKAKKKMLEESARLGVLSIVDALLKLPDVKLNDRYYEPLRIAACNDDLILVERFLSSSEISSPDILRMILKRAADQVAITVVARLLEIPGVHPQEPEVLDHLPNRHDVAIRLCSPSFRFTQLIRAAYSSSYVSLKQPLPHVITQMILEWMWPNPVYQSVLAVHQELRRLLSQLCRLNSSKHAT